MPKLPLIIEADALPDYLNNPAVRIIDLCGDDSYRQQHIPNAVHIDYMNLVSVNPPVGGLLPDEHQFAELMGSLGIGNDTPIIAYDDEGGGKTARLLWTLHVFGHSNNSMLNGGLAAWVLNGGEVNNAPSQVQSTEFTIKRDNNATADAEYILQHLNDSDFTLLDARSPGEYDGSLVRSAKGGHIPGAINYEWTRAMDANQLRKMRSKEELQQELTELGFKPEQNIVTYCQTHHRSAYTWLMLRWLGYDKAKGYPGSWSDWGNRTDTPVK